MFESFNDEDSLMNNIRDVLLELDDINFRTSVTKKSDSLERITINIDKSTNQVGVYPDKYLFSLNDVNEYLKRINDIIISEDCKIKNIHIVLSNGSGRFLNIKRIEEFPEWILQSINLQFIPK
jgi:histidinol phosphatase-like enzyme